MMNKHIRILIYVISMFFFTTFKIPAYAQNIIVKDIPLLDKLPIKAIHRIFQDSDGYMWYGTFNGLCRSDGYNIRVFRSDLYHPGLLADNYITYISEDHNKKIWFGTMKGGYILDKATYQITRIDLQELTNTNVFTINVTNDGTIWVSMPGALFHYKTDGSLIKRYSMKYNGQSGCIYFVYENKKNELLISVTGNGMYKLNKAKDEFQPYHHHNNYKDIERIIWDDEHQCYWLGTWGNGILRFNPEAPSEEQRYIPQPLPVDITGKSVGAIYHMVQDDTFKYIWVTSWNDLYAFRITSDGSLEQVDTSSFLNPGNKILYEIYKDKQGKLWVSAFDVESFIIDIRDYIVKDYSLPDLRSRIKATPAIVTLFKDKGDVFWLSQDRYGLCIYDIRNNKLKHYSECPGMQHLPFGAIDYMVKSNNSEKVWVVPSSSSTVFGLSRQGMDIQAKLQITLDNLSKNPGRINTAFEDANKNLWIGSTTGLYIYKISKSTLEVVTTVKGNVAGITQTTDGKIWVTLKEKGICCIKPDKQVENYLFNKDFVCIASTSDGKIWLGTSEGEVLLFDPNHSKELQDYSRTCGMNGDIINNIIVDNYNHVWITTNHTLKEFNPRNGAYRSYTTHEPKFQIQRFFSQAICYDPQGAIYFGGIGGIVSIPPSQQLESIPQQVTTHISDIKIMGQSLSENNKNILPENGTIEISADDQNLEIEFSSLDFHNLEQIRYAYRLIGVDNNWIYLNEGKNSAFYNKLDKGYYTFQVKATDKNGLWSDKVTEIKIHRLPALYETWWAYTLYIFLVIGIVWIILRLYLLRVKQENSQKLSEQITQIKLHYFTNISHELLTPLTILSCLSDEMELSGKEDATKISLMQSNIQRLKRLLQQVLDFRKVESKNMKLYVSYGDIQAFVQNTCESSFALPMKNKHINFSFTTEDNKVEGYFDQDKLDKILFNLLSNALKYTSANKNVNVKVESYTQDSHHFVRIIVEDEGKGIAPKEIDKIFTRFYSSQLNDAGLSNGIGLSLTKELVELHHGVIKAQSQLEKGSVFIIEIPIDKESYATHEFKEMSVESELNKTLLKRTQQTETEELSDDTKSDYNLLLVEDNEELLLLMKSIFHKFYNVATATNGCEALEYIKENNVDVIISDIIMPEMNGLQLCQSIKTDISTSHIIVILLTSDTNTKMQIDSYNMGADAYVAKPFKTSILNAQLESLLKKRRTSQMQFTANPIETSISDSSFTSLDQQFIKKALDIVEQNLSDADLDVTILADKLNMSRSTLTRKIKVITGKTPLDFIKDIKMQHARQMLENKTATVADVIIALGYSDHKNFTNTFKKTFGMTPSDYLKREQNKEDDR